MISRSRSGPTAPAICIDPADISEQHGDLLVLGLKRMDRCAAAVAEPGAGAQFQAAGRASADAPIRPP